MRLFVHRPRDTGCEYYRATLPIRHLMPALAKADVRVTYSQQLDDSRGYDAYRFSRFVDPECLPFLIGLKRRGKRIWWDLDDDLLDLSRHRPERRAAAEVHVRTLELCLDLADVITVSTLPLAGVVNRPEKTVVAPNLLDFDDNPFGVCRPYLSLRGTSILYAGSPSHLEDLELVRDLHRRTSSRSAWTFYGVKPPWIDRRAVYIPWGRVSDYPRVCRMVRPDICLMPLQPCRFNESKSPIKVWECVTLGASLVASDVGPYRGHPAAIAAAGEAFTEAHLEAAYGNWDTSQFEAVRNSWQHSITGPSLWFDAFTRLSS